jgi:hypothetical protein
MLEGSFKKMTDIEPIVHLGKEKSSWNSCRRDKSRDIKGP